MAAIELLVPVERRDAVGVIENDSFKIHRDNIRFANSRSWRKAAVGGVDVRPD
jgi:hypothetical protein